MAFKLFKKQDISQSIISNIVELLALSFLSKYGKFDAESKSAIKNW